MAKAIVDIEINDGAWRRFNAQVEAHRANLKNMPGQWGAVGKSIQAASGAAAKFVATIKTQAKALKDSGSMAGRMTLFLKASDRVATSLAKHTFTVARNLKDATRSLLSWGAIMGLMSGVLGAGGLFGISRMAQSVAAGTAQARGTGSSYGGAKAANIAYGGLLGGEGGVQSLLQRMAHEKEAGGAMFGRVGLRPEQWQGKAPSDILGEFLKAAKEAYTKAPEGAQAKAMEVLAPDLDFTKIKQMSDTNLDILDKEYQSYKRQLEISRGTQDTWSRFTRSMDFAGERLEKTFVDSLVPLAPALEKFSVALNKAIATVMGHPMVKNMIAGAGATLQKGADYLLSDQFSKDFKGFMEELKKIGQAMSDTAAFLSKWLGDDPHEKDVKRMQELRETLTPANPKPGWNKGLVEQIPGQAPPVQARVSATVVIQNEAGGKIVTQAKNASGIAR